MTRRRAECHFTRSAVLGLLAFAILGGTLSAAPDLELAIGARNALVKPPAVRLTRKIPPLVRQTCKQLATDTPLRVVARHLCLGRESCRSPVCTASGRQRTR